MMLRDILAGKGGTVYSIAPEATVRDVAQNLIRHRIGALLVCAEPEHAMNASQILGIVSERDVLRACSEGLSLDTTLVTEVMTTQVILGKPEDLVESVMGLMTSRRVRHLPVAAEGSLIGIVSIGDIVKSQLGRLAMENQFMKDYIQS
jgi:CBS domain-containing protein